VVPRGSIGFASSGTLCARRLSMTTISWRLSAGARPEELFATHRREGFAVQVAMAWRESVIVHLD